MNWWYNKLNQTCYCRESNIIRARCSSYKECRHLLQPPGANFEQGLTKLTSTFTFLRLRKNIQEKSFTWRTKWVNPFIYGRIFSVSHKARDLCLGPSAYCPSSPKYANTYFYCILSVFIFAPSAYIFYLFN